jgi:hypothetical protein
MATKTEFQKMTLDATLADLQEQNGAISTQIAELSAKGTPDEKKLAPLIEQQNAIKQNIAGIITSERSVMEKIAIEQAKKSEGGNLTDMQLTVRSLTEKLGRPPTATEVQQDMHTRKVAEQKTIAEIRIPPYQQAGDLPPGYAFNRKTGKYRDPEGNEVSPEKFAGLFAERQSWGQTSQH